MDLPAASHAYRYQYASRFWCNEGDVAQTAPYAPVCWCCQKPMVPQSDFKNPTDRPRGAPA